jgi:hypothetical protein
MTVAAVLLPPDRIPLVWPMVRPFVETVEKEDPAGVSVADVRDKAESGRMQLWLAWDSEAQTPLAAVGTQIEIGHDNSLIARVLFCTGHDLDRWLMFLSAIEEWAKSVGCSVVKSIARKGYGRKLASVGYRDTHVFIEKALA